MLLLMFFLVLAAMFPWLLLPLLLFFLFNLMLIPFGFTIRSMWNLFTVPGELIRVAFNPNLRKNHALEHATINVIEERYGPQRLSGHADQSGFYIYGAVDPNLLEAAARAGHGRLLAGERELVVHRRCGTTIAAANFISSAAFLGLLLATRHFTFFNVVIALAIANLIGPLLGTILQKYVTTSWDVRDREIVGIEYNWETQPTLFFGGWTAVPQKFFIRTRRIY
ncbi:MAG TPA: hypothetical protein GXX69_10430 [Firmicutes bacterium]|nr:hypothetical protein [Bacillota bacterium]